MKSLDTHSSLRIAVLMEMLDDVSRATDADSAFRAYARRLRRVRPVDALLRVSIADLPLGQYRVVRALRLDIAGARHPEISVPQQDWSAAPVYTGGMLGNIVNLRGPALLHELALEPDHVLGELLLGMTSCMGLPMFENGRITGWSCLFRADPEPYTIADLEDALLISNLMGAMIRNLASVEQISALNSKLQEQFDDVARVQHALLPSAVPTIPGASFAVSYQTSTGAGGDSYDFFDLGSGRVGILISDVSGHGPAAATVMAMLHSILHARPDLCATPAAALAFANAKLEASSIEGGHVTAVFAVLDTQARRLTFARAGHPLPRLRTDDGRVTEIAGEGAAPMGIVAENYYPPETTIELEPGQTVVLYTDGITEAANAAAEQFGVPGLDHAIVQSSGEPQDVVMSVLAALNAHTGNAPRTDDQTLVVFRIEQ